MALKSRLEKLEQIAEPLGSVVRVLALDDNEEQVQAKIEQAKRDNPLARLILVRTGVPHPQGC